MAPTRAVSRCVATTIIIDPGKDPAERRIGGDQFDIFARVRTPVASQGKEPGMKTLHHLLLAALLTCIAAAGGPALAQQAAPRWKPGLESVIISAQKPM